MTDKSALYWMVFILLYTKANAALFNIVPSTSASCSHDQEPCLTLSQFAADINKYLHMNTTLILKQGNHSLETDLVVRKISEFRVLSIGAIIYKQAAVIEIHNVNNVCIRGITFIGTGGNRLELVNNFMLEYSSFIGKENATQKQCYLVCNKQNHTDTALELISTTATIVNSSFISNACGKCCHDIVPANYNDTIHNNNMAVGGGIIAYKSNVKITGSRFEENKAELGGAIYGFVSKLHISESTFVENSVTCPNGADCNGGGLFVFQKQVHSNVLLEISESEFHDNSASSSGGAICVRHVVTHIQGSTFKNNTALVYGGAIHLTDHLKLHVNGSQFFGNSAKLNGGALYVVSNFSFHHTITISKCNISFNEAEDSGGSIYLIRATSLSLDFCTFQENKASSGSTLYFFSVKKIWISMCEFMNNKIRKTAFSSGINFAGIIEMTDISGEITDIMLKNNVGSLVLVNSKSISISEATFVGNRLSHELYSNGGGAITLIQSEVEMKGKCVMKFHSVTNGGGIYAANSKIEIKGKVTVTNNTANESGGGLYLYQSELNCEAQSSLLLLGNIAGKKGGGMCAISSILKMLTEVNTVYLKYHYYFSNMTVTENRARLGGGFCLEMNSKLYIVKQRVALRHISNMLVIIKFTVNSALYGGAIHVVDETNYETCSSQKADLIANECFIQDIGLYLGQSVERVTYINTVFLQNYAKVSGSDIYGGLLDRCTVNPKVDLPKHITKDIGGLNYLKEVTNINESTISSSPVKVCFCTDESKNCRFSHQQSVQVMKGHNFTLSLVAVDQVNRNTIANIYGSLLSSKGGLGINQANQSIGSVCTSLNYSVVSPNHHEYLSVYADGPCKDAQPSQQTVKIEFLPCSCPIGFQPKPDVTTECGCECDKKLYPYITECDYQSKTLVREGSYWVSPVNNSNDYLIYPYCPLDYCKPATLRIKMNFATMKDINLQCSDNRVGLLCGQCQRNYSLSLGSSRCIQCSSHWYITFVVVSLTALTAGVALVLLILALNLTVAVGTLNGIIFYVNVMKANSSIFFSQATENYITVFMDWLNLEIGFDTCFFEKMDAYSKTFFQLAFPCYLIVLVVTIIIACEYSTKFARLIGKKNPVATLATLILLSYTKLLRTIIDAFSFSILEYPNGIHRWVWLPDASVKYLQGKHIALFITALLILLPGIAFTLILLFWQWLLRYQHKEPFRWVRYNKLKLFLEPYHAPYKFSHRYWIGLLLLFRVVLYIIVSVVNDPSGHILVTGILMLCLLTLKTYSGNVNGVLYRNWPVDLIETICYINLTLCCLIILFILQSASQNSRDIVAYVSGTITLVLLMIIVTYHVIFEFLAKTKIWRKIERAWRNINSEEDNVFVGVSEDHNGANQATNQPTVSIVSGPTRDGANISPQGECGADQQLLAVTTYGTTSLKTAKKCNTDQFKNKLTEQGTPNDDELCPLITED